MRQRRPASYTTPFVRVVSAIGILLAGALLTFGGLQFFGLLDSEKNSQTPSREGMVQVPRSLRQITALTKVTREDIYDLAQGDDSYFWMDKARVQANPDWIVSVSQIVGRVMARNKSANLVFTERDFLPEGSRTGLSGGIPEGKQGFFLPSSKIPGLGLLKMGDTFDLLAGLPEEARGQPQAEYGLLAGGMKVRGGKPIPLSGVRLLVQGAQMVAVTRGRDMTTQGELDLPASNTSRSRTQTGGTTQITIAIDPEEAVPLTKALAADRVIHCVPLSGQQESADDADALRTQLAGMVVFPATARAVKAYTRITADDLADPDTGELRTYYFDPNKASKSWIASVNDLIGRVVARDTSAGFIFSEDDFLQGDAVINDISAYARIKPHDLADPLSSSRLIGRVVGKDIPSGSVITDSDLLPADAAITVIEAYARIKATDLADPQSASDLIGRVVADVIPAGSTIGQTDLLPPDAPAGIAGGTPADRMGITVDVKTVRGVGSLRRGDRFDLVASDPFSPGSAISALGGTVQVSSGAVSQAELDDRARNTVLARAAIVVEIDNATATIAVRPDEVVGITKAITLGTSIYALARSGRSDAASDLGPSLLESDPNPLDRITLVEEIVGGRRTWRVFAAARKNGDSNSDLATPKDE